MVCKNARNPAKRAQKHANERNFEKCSFENINLGQVFIARAEIEDSGTSCVFEQKKRKRAKEKVSMEGPGSKGTNFCSFLSWPNIFSSYTGTPPATQNLAETPGTRGSRPNALRPELLLRRLLEGLSS